jgi:hypothetical protein
MTQDLVRGPGPRTGSARERGRPREPHFDGGRPAASDAARCARREQARSLAALPEHHLPGQRSFNRRHEFKRRQRKSA